MSEASQTMNDTKSTVVMEFSTVQKVVQVVDNDSEVNPPRIAFKEVILKDMTGKKNDHKTEQIFTNNNSNFMVTGKSSWMNLRFVIKYWRNRTAQSCACERTRVYEIWNYIMCKRSLSCLIFRLSIAFIPMQMRADERTDDASKATAVPRRVHEYACFRRGFSPKKFSFSHYHQHDALFRSRIQKQSLSPRQQARAPGNIHLI